jgi:ribosomal protein S18 acetylase RimI-like enzyme
MDLANDASGNRDTHITLLHELRPGDIGTIVRMHGTIYAVENGFDVTFEAYVAAPLGEFVSSGCKGGRIWLAEQNGEVVGCIAIVPALPNQVPSDQHQSTPTQTNQAQLRWFLVDPRARGLGVGRRLIESAVTFAREQGYQSMILWTVSELTAAASLYRAVGFRKIHEAPAFHWGKNVTEECYQMAL